jgi:phage terminase large subunit
MEFKFRTIDPHQTKFVYSDKRYILNSGGVGGGKTYSIVLRTLRLIIQHPGILILIGGQTYPLIRDTTLREFINLVPSELLLSYNKTNQHFIFKNGSEVIFRAFDDASKLKSLNLGACGIEEMTDISEDIIKMLRTRIRQPGMPGCIYGATNPGTFGNWVYKYFIEKPLPDSEVIYSITADNFFLPDEYLKDLETMKDNNPEYYQRMVMGKWGSLEGLIYNFPMEQRVNPVKFSKLKRFIAGLDFGFTHPTAMVIIGIDPDDKYYIVDEVYQHKLTSAEIGQIAKDKMEQWNIEVVYCDSARPEIIEDLQRLAIPAEAAIKDVFDGIMHVKSLIGQKRLFCSPDCKFMLREFDSYIWDAKSTVKEQPLKVNDDMADSARYALFSEHKKYAGHADDFDDYDGREKFDEF